MQISPNSLLFEPAGTHRGVLARDRRAFTVALSASLAGVTAAVLVGSLAPLNSTWAADRGTGAAAGQSQVPVPGSPVPGSAVSGAAVPWSVSSLGALAGPAVSQQPPSRAGQLPTSTRPLGGLTSGKDGKGGKHRKGRTVGDGRGHGPHRGRQPGQPGQRGQSSQPGQPGVAAGMGAGSGTAGSGTAGSVPPVVVSYVVDREWAGGFQGQVRVVNNGTQPVAGWQAVIALPRDRVTWFWNASGFVSHRIMLLRPLSADEVVPAGGGTLSVFFTATGPETAPQACAFDGIYCG